MHEVAIGTENVVLPTLSAGMMIKHKQQVKWFGSHNWTTQQLWIATLILPDPPWCSHIGWVESDELSGVLRLLHQCSSMCWKWWNRIQEDPEESMVLFEMLQNESIRLCRFRSYWEYWVRLQDNSTHLEPGAVIFRCDYCNVYIK